MAKRWVLLVTILITIALTVSGCATSKVDDDNDEPKLSMYLLAGERLDYLFIVDYLRTYEYMYKKWTTCSGFEDAETMYDQIRKEIYAGRGPDVILINSATSQYLDLYKLSESDALADLDTLIENSETFNLEDYNEKAMDTGVINGKRIMMPVEFGVNYCVAIEETFDHHEIDLPETLTLTSYLDTLDEYYSNVEERPAMLGFEEEHLLAQFYTVGEYLEKSEELKRLLDTMKIERDRSRYGGQYNFERAEWVHYFLDAHQWFYTNRYLYLGPVGRREDVYYRMFHLQYNTIQKHLEKNIAWYPQPCREGGSSQAYVEYGLAINNNSKHKEEAFEFIEIILGKIKQTTANTIHFPVRKDSLEDRNKEFRKGLNISYLDPLGFGAYGVHPDVFPDESIPDEVTQDFIAYVEGVEEYKYIGHFKFVYYTFMKKSINDYYKGYITYDELIDEINNKLKLYYSE